MDKKIAPCGLDCAECEAYQATQAHDKEALAEIAAKWSEQYRTELKAENVLCDGCTDQSGRNGCYSKMCSVRMCVDKRKLANCAGCRDYGCDKIAELHEIAPEAKKNLDPLRPKKR